MKRAIYLGCLCFLWLPLWSDAATLYLDPGVATINRGDSVTLALRIMPDTAVGECINAVDAVIRYPDNIQPVDVSLGRSILNIWVERPVIDKDSKTITLAGGLPNGYCGRIEGDPRLTNIVAEIVFRSPGLQIGGGSSVSNVAQVDFGEETQVLLNDGFGTKAPLRLLGATITLEPNAGPVLTDDWREQVRLDTVPPEPFSITLSRDEEGKAFNGKYFISFNTTDKQTGVSYYEVMEEPITELGRFSWGGVDAAWIKTSSPYELKDQSLNSVIRVRAIDKAGNEYLATYIPEESLRSYSRANLIYYTTLGLAVVALISITLVSVWWYRRRRAVATADHNLAELEKHDNV